MTSFESTCRLLAPSSPPSPASSLRARPDGSGGIGIALALSLATLGLSVGPTQAMAQERGGSDSSAEAVVELLEAERPVLGIFSGDQTAAQGRRIVEVEAADFILYSLERPPFDVDGMRAYLEGMRDAGGPGVLSEMPVVLRVPPIAEGEDVTRRRVERGIAAGAGGIVFPHVTTAEEASFSAEVLREIEGRRGGGPLLDILILEDRAAIEAVREIVGTPGPDVVFAGPGDLRRAYDGEMEAVEAAIQRVLAACLEFEVPCGVTAGSDDIGKRLDEGFRVIIVTEIEALEAARRWEEARTRDIGGPGAR